MTEKTENLAETPNQPNLPTSDAPLGDPLSDVLNIVHVQGESARLVAPPAPQSVMFPSDRPCFHLIQHGQVVLQLENEDTFTLEQHQLALLLHGHAHRIHFGGGGPEIPVEAVEAPDPDPAAQCFWGSFSFHNELAENVLSALPPVVVIRNLEKNPIDFLEMGCHIVLGELQTNLPGARVMVSRMLDLALVHILRRWAKDAKDVPGWLAGAHDKRLSRAIRAFHGDPARPWKVEELARLAGMSRSSFVTRFEQVMGQPPGTYLRTWRLDRAAELLRFSTKSAEEIAEQVGYTSQEAFSRAFVKRFKESPAAWRKTQ